MEVVQVASVEPLPSGDESARAERRLFIFSVFQLSSLKKYVMGMNTVMLMMNLMRMRVERLSYLKALNGGLVSASSNGLRNQDW